MIVHRGGTGDREEFVMVCYWEGLQERSTCSVPIRCGGMVKVGFPCPENIPLPPSGKHVRSLEYSHEFMLM